MQPNSHVVNPFPLACLAILSTAFVCGCLAPASLSSKGKITESEVEQGLKRQKEVNELKSRGSVKIQKGTGLDDRARDVEMRLGYQ
jgi:hypothetical protein